MKIDFIGTSAGTPTSKYGTSGIFINTGQRKLLLDCGEGTQKRIMRFGSSINIDDIFLTHLDSDHTLGIPGLIRTLDLNNRNRDLDIPASEDIKPKLKTLIDGVHSWPSYAININCFDSGGLVKSFEI
jgi:ribonuclease Z